MVPALPDSSLTLAGTWSHLEDLFDISLPSGQSNRHIAFEAKILAGFPPTPNLKKNKKNTLFSCAEMSGMLI